MKGISLHRLTWLLVALLGGCSSGGGDGGGGLGGPPAEITAANAPAIAGAVSEAVLDSDFFGDLLETGPVMSAAAVSPGAERAFAVLAASVPSILELSSIPIGPETLPCDVSGSLTISGEVADPLTLSSGDSFTIEFAACNDGNGEVLNGAFGMVVVGIQGDLASGQYLLSVSMTVTAFQVTAGNDVTSATASLSVSVDTTMPPVTSVSVSADVLTVTTNGVTESLGSFTTTHTQDESMFPVGYAADSSGTYTNSDIAGNVTFDTPVTFQGIGEEFPFAGEMLITGADGASIRLIALDNTNVRLLIDVDGDQAVDVTIDTTWLEITADSPS